MATLEKVRDEDYSISADGSSVTRIKYVEGESLKDIVDSGLLPGYRSVHPVFRRLRLDNCSFSQTGNTGGRVQGIVTASYSSGKNSGGSDSSGEDIDPWKLDAQNYSAQPFQIEKPLNYIYNTDGQRVQLLNSAGCRIEATGEVYGVEHSFVFYTKNEPQNLPQQPVINASTIRVAGESFAKFSAMMMPPAVTHIVDRDDTGKIIRSYYEIPVTIRTFPDGWLEQFLDVGTLALFGNDPTPQPIYKYSPWTGTNDAANLQVRPVFGSIQDVIAAKKAYAKAKSGKEDITDQTYMAAYKELPYEEMTEPLPLDNGRIYTAALTDPNNHPYRTIDGFKVQIVNFGQFNIPKKREGK